MNTPQNEPTHPMPHILVVDDEPGICQMVELCLRKAGNRVSSAENAASAYHMLELEPYDVIVTDVMMPDEDGIHFLRRVHLRWPEMPVILMTGYAQLQMAVNAIKNGAFDFIHKPFDFEHLCKIVDRAIDYTKLQRMEKHYRAELEETVTRRTAELKKAMAELDYTRSALLKAATDKSNFMSNISHEMRTPMNGIVGALELLAEEGVSGLQGEYLAMARQSADEMLAMINELLTFNNGIGQSGGVRCDLINLKALLQGIVAENLPRFVHKKLSLTLSVSADVPSQIWVDKEQLARLLEILLGNSVKFTDQGGVHLDVSVEGSANDGGFLFCSVTDSGIGIPEGMLELVFEPFVQGDGSFTRRHGGAGLGLAIARQNIMLLNGSLWAEHVPGGGSSFKFRFKLITP